jgi:transposase
LKNKVKKSRKPKLNNDQLSQIYKWIEKDSNLTLNALKIGVKEEFFVEISQVGLWKKLKQLGLSYITLRPKNYLQKPKKIAEFVNTIGKKTKEKTVFFFDESLFGTHLKIGKAWLKK